MFHYGHSRAWFDTRACREGFKTDRACGLIYGPYRRADGSFFMSAEQMSAETKTCPYCGQRGR